MPEEAVSIDVATPLKPPLKKKPTWKRGQDRIIYPLIPSEESSPCLCNWIWCIGFFVAVYVLARMSTDYHPASSLPEIVPVHNATWREQHENNEALWWHYNPFQHASAWRSA